MTRWERPYSLDAPTTMAYVFTVFLTFSMVAVVVSHPLGAADLIVAIFAPMLVYAVLSTRVGLYVSSFGVRARGRLKSTIVPWSQIADIRSGFVTYFGTVSGRRGIELELIDGTSVMTPIRLRLPWRMFGIDERNDVTGVSLHPAEYEHILETLRHLRSVHGGPPRPVAPDPVPAAPPRPDAAAQLHTLQRLRQRGSITEAEYARLRDELTP